MYSLEISPIFAGLEDPMKKYSLMLALLLVAVVSGYSQTGDVQSYQFRNGKTFTTRLNNSQKKLLSGKEKDFKEALGVKTESEFALLDKKTDRLGFTKYRFQQSHHGRKVEYGTVSVHSRNGVAETVSAEFHDVPASISPIPLLSESNALDVAIEYVGAETYSWNEEHNAAAALPVGELLFVRVYIANEKKKKGQMALAYRFDIHAVKPLSRRFIYVDAHDGFVIHENAIIKHATGTASTRYSGVRSIGTTFNSATSKYNLIDQTRGNGIETYNLNHGANYNAATQFGDSDNNWSSAEYNNLNRDNAALDAHWGAMMTYDYFLLKHNRNSFDDHGAKIKSYVHYQTDYANAFWNGSHMTYGDGSATIGPLTTLDVCAHEIGHAVCSATADLIYVGEPGAINEGLSDIWGASVEHFAAPEKSTWEIGEEINVAIRSMSDPNSLDQPDTYNGDLWVDGADVHTNSGILNHWYYLLVEGGSGANDHGTSYNVQGLGFETAANIVYRMESEYLTANSGYAEARIASVQAAADLYGSNSDEVVQTGNAWTAVGVYQDIAPANLLATATGNDVLVTWQDNADDETAFVVERSVNSADNFQTVATLPVNTVEFSDNDLASDHLYFYRVRVLSPSNPSAYSHVVSVSLGSAPRVLTTASLQICSSSLTDPGGLGNYSDNTHIVSTLLPDGPDSKVTLSFTSFDLETDWDYLYVYDGSSTSAQVVGVFTGSGLPPSVTATNDEGTLTLEFVTDEYVNNPGFEAMVTCGPVISMHQGSVSSCNALFVDSGGGNNYSDSEDLVLTISSDTPGRYPKLVFSEFHVEQEYDYLQAFNGSSVSSPALGAFTGSEIPPVIMADNPDGTITFRFSSDFSLNYSGWKAQLTCYGELAEPEITFNNQVKTFGDPSFDLVATAYSGADFSYEVVEDESNTGEVLLSGTGGRTVMILKAGLIKIKAVLHETDVYAAGERTILLTINKGAPAITFDDVSKAIGENEFELNASAYPGASFLYSIVDDPQNTGNVALSGDGNRTVTLLAEGRIKLKASLASTANYHAAEMTAVLTIYDKLDPVIMFENLVKPYGAPSFNLEARSYAGASFVYQVEDTPDNTGTVTLSGVGNAAVNVVKVGTVKLRASLSETALYRSAEKTITLTISKGTPVISFESISKTYGDQPFTLNAIAYSGAEFTYSVAIEPSNSGEVVLSGINNENVTVLKAGVVKLQASLHPTENYDAAVKTTLLSIQKAVPAITFSDMQLVFDDQTHDLNASSYTGANILYSVVNTGHPGKIEMTSINQFKIVTAGTAEVKATVGQSANYSAASKTILITIGKAHQEIQVTHPPEIFNTASQVPLWVTATSGLPVSLHVLSGPANIIDNAVALTGATGPLAVEAIQNGNENYFAAEQRSFSINVTLDPVLGTENLNDPSIELWPNPASGFVEIRSNQRLMTLTLINQLGSQVTTRRINDTAFTMPLLDVADGVYAVMLTTENGKVIVKRIEVGRR
jgi:Zn-dependent metalloprotease